MDVGIFQSYVRYNYDVNNKENSYADVAKWWGLWCDDYNLPKHSNKGRNSQQVCNMGLYNGCVASPEALKVMAVLPL